MRRLFATLLLIALTTITPTMTSAQSARTSAPTSVTQEKIEVSTVWRNINNVLEEDGKYATSSVVQGMPTHVLRATGFNFNLPDDATVVGIVVEIRKRAESSSISDSMIKLIKRGVISGRQHCQCSVGWPVIEPEYRTHGAARDLWGLDNDGQKVTPTDVNSPDFGVAISAYNIESEYTQREAGIDCIKITVYFYPVLSKQASLFDEAEVDLLATLQTGHWTYRQVRSPQM